MLVLPFLIVFKIHLDFCSYDVCVSFARMYVWIDLSSLPPSPLLTHIDARMHAYAHSCQGYKDASYLIHRISMHC